MHRTEIIVVNRAVRLAHWKSTTSGEVICATFGACVRRVPVPIPSQNLFSDLVHHELSELVEWLRTLARELLLGGVVHRDLHAGNIVRGRRTGAL